MVEVNGTNQVTLNVVYNRLVGICKEMGSTMMRAAYSPIFSESLDFSCVVFDRDGVMLAQSEFSPAQVGAIRFVVKWLIAEIGDDALKPGDVVVHNDPYRGGVHMPEHVVIKAVYHEGEIFGYVANIAHMSEIGGLAPGGFAATATEVYQEGLRLPPVWLMREGEYVQDIWRIIMTNHRAPRYSWGDLHAMLASLNIAERRLHEILETYGADGLRGICSDLMAHSERWMRVEIAAIPDGEYYYEDSISNATDPPEADWFRLRVVINGDSLIADFTGSDPQGPHVMNCTYGVTASAVYNAVLQIVDNDIPHNDGVYRPITVIAPPGTVVNVVEPGASVAGNTETHPRLWAIVLGALAQAVPDRASASTGGSSSNFLFGGTHPHTDQYYVHYHLEGVGWGGRDEADGNSNQVVPNGNCPNTPVEIFETRYPFVQKAYRLRQDSGGPGRHRGGLSTERIMEVRTDDITVSAVFNGMVKRPRGLFGAGGGATSELTVKRAGSDEFLTFRDAFGTRSNSRFANIKLTHGDEVCIRTPGGGGFGRPWERDVELVRRDVEEQFVSIDAARSNYGVAISEDGDDLTVDQAATEALRAELAAAAKIGTSL
ncbi:MAG: hydantoinase B/oxoprolinase family protein [Chloroflexota bacterium]|nr:hydantoinase B/oxoprolinase family protein [Chloroflexota bacterium]